MQKVLEKTITWIKNNSGRLLLYAVILTGCFSIKNAAYGKYVELLRDFTSAVSAPFYFSSNYLGEISDDKKYTIGTFNGSSYELDVEIRNNDNAYNYNEAGKDFYYYVTAELYTDENYTVPYAYDNYSTTIKYGKNNEYAAAMAKEVKSYVMATESQIIDGQKVIVDVPVYHENIIIDKSTNTYNNADQYKLLGRLDGLTGTDGMADVKNEGKQSVRILIAWNGTFDGESIYLKVTAHTVPATTITDASDPTKICQIDKALFGDVLFPSTYKNAFTHDSTCPGVINGYDKMKGIYAAELQGKFKLTNDTEHQTIHITKDMSESKVDYTVLYTFKSNANATVRLYYDSSKLTPDDSLGTKYTGSYPKEDGSGTCDKYVSVQMFANGAKSCYFYKDRLGTEVSYHDVRHVVDTGEE